MAQVRFRLVAIWVEFVVCSRLAPRDFSGFFRFLPSKNANISKIQFDRDIELDPYENQLRLMWLLKYYNFPIFDRRALHDEKSASFGDVIVLKIIHF